MFAPSYVGPTDQFNRRSGAFSDGGRSIPTSAYGWHPSEQAISELPSPTAPTAPENRAQLAENELWFPRPPSQKQEQPPMELPGDTHINQHHPAFSGDAETMDSVGEQRRPRTTDSAHEHRRPGTMDSAHEQRRPRTMDSAREQRRPSSGVLGASMDVDDVVSPLDAPRPLGVAE